MSRVKGGVASHARHRKLIYIRTGGAMVTVAPEMIRAEGIDVEVKDAHGIWGGRSKRRLTTASKQGGQWQQ